MVDGELWALRRDRAPDPEDHARARDTIEALARLRTELRRRRDQAVAVAWEAIEAARRANAGQPVPEQALAALAARVQEAAQGGADTRFDEDEPPSR